MRLHSEWIVATAVGAVAMACSGTSGTPSGVQSGDGGASEAGAGASSGGDSAASSDATAGDDSGTSSGTSGGSGTSSGGTSTSSSSSSGSSSSGGSGGSGSGSSGSSGTSSSSGSSGGAAGYHVSGNQVLDANNQPHLFRGLDRPSLEWSTTGVMLSAADYAHMATDWKANVVRISLNQDYWLSASPNFSGGYAGVVDQQVQWAEQNKLDVILDLHWSDRGDYTIAAAQQCMADAHSVTFWGQVAAKYKSDPHILFELYNEPHDVSWSVWLSGGNGGTTCAFQVAGMQQLYNAVRATGAPNLVVIGGLSWAFDLSGVPSNPVQGTNIIYNTHPYATSCSGGCQASNFDAKFGFLAATYPVIATEFGDSDCSAGYDQTFTSYAHTKGLHWTAWAYYVSSCKFPSVISDWNGTPVSGSGTTIQAALASP